MSGSSKTDIVRAELYRLYRHNATIPGMARKAAASELLPHIPYYVWLSVFRAMDDAVGDYR